MTTSEQLFERFCTQSVIPFVRLLPDGIETPDYEITLGGVRVIVEIKELTPNEEEWQALCELEEKHSTSWGGTVGKRVRYKIDAAKHQLERLAGGRCAGVLLLYDARPQPFRGISPYEIEVAMYGFEAIDLHVPEGIGTPVHFGTHRFGKGKKLRHDCHTYISAIGILRETDTSGQYHIDFYHNVHTDHPLPLTEILRRKDMTVFTVAPGKGNEFRGWARMVTNEEYRDANQASEAIGTQSAPQPQH